MTDTLGERMTDDDWNSLDTERKMNVMSTYIIDLENEVADLNRRLDRAERDIEIVDNSY